MGLKVNLGVRPEDLIASDDDDYLYQGEVDLIEALGELTVLYFKPDAPNANPVLAKLGGTHAGLRGKDGQAEADPAKLHLFPQQSIAAVIAKLRDAKQKPREGSPLRGFCFVLSAWFTRCGTRASGSRAHGRPCPRGASCRLSRRSRLRSGRSCCCCG